MKGKIFFMLLTAILLSVFSAMAYDTTNLTSCYSFDDSDTSGSVSIDIMGRNNLTLTNVLTGEDGVLGQQYFFLDGTSKAVAGNGLIHTSVGFTILFYMNLTRDIGAGENYNVMGMQNNTMSGSLSSGFFAGMFAGNKMRIIIPDDGCLDASTDGADWSGFTPNITHKIAIVFNGSGTTREYMLRMYRNESFTAADAYYGSNINAITDCGLPFVIGQTALSISDNTSPVKIDNFVIFNRTLDEAEIDTLFTDEVSCSDFLAAPVVLNVSNVNLTSTLGTNLTTEDLTVTWQATGEKTNSTDWRNNSVSLALVNYDFSINLQGTHAIYDLSTTGDAALVTRLNWTPDGKVGGAYTFFADAQEGVSIGALTGNLTSLSMWFNKTLITNATGAGILVAFDSQGGGGLDATLRTSSLTSQVDNEIIVLTEGDGAVSAFGYCNATESLTGGWHHLVFQLNESMNGWEIYLDNDRVDNCKNGEFQGVPLSNVHLGRISGSASGAWNGGMDEFALWRNRLSREQITELYNAGLAGLPMSIIDSSMTTTGGTWTVNVIVTDYTNGTQASMLSNPLTILVTLPSGKPVLNITNFIEVSVQQTIGITNVTDADGYSVYINGILNNASVSSVFTTSFLTSSIYNVSVLPFNADGNGEFSDNYTIIFDIDALTITSFTPANAAELNRNDTANIDVSITCEDNDGINSIAYNITNSTGFISASGIASNISGNPVIYILNDTLSIISFPDGVYNMTMSCSNTGETESVSEESYFTITTTPITPTVIELSYQECPQSDEGIFLLVAAIMFSFVIVYFGFRFHRAIGFIGGVSVIVASLFFMPCSAIMGIMILLVGVIMCGIFAFDFKHR